MTTKRERKYTQFDPERRSEIARLGGLAVQRSGKAHRWTSQEAADAGRKGGMAKRRKRSGFVEEL